MDLALTINKADDLIKDAAAFHSAGNSSSCLAVMKELRDLLNEPIEVEQGEGSDTSENCSLCGQPKQE